VTCGTSSIKCRRGVVGPTELDVRRESVTTRDVSHPGAEDACGEHKTQADPQHNAKTPRLCWVLDMLLSPTPTVCG